MPDLPTGNVTFLFSDVQGSTALVERDRAAAGQALERHHALLRQNIEDHDGCVFETIGDAVYAAFARPSDAVAAALDGQRALLQEPWSGPGPVRVRMGLHTGEVETRAGGHYFGQPLFRTARLMAIGHGGQILLSAATATLVQDMLPADAQLQNLGRQRLKDLAEPEQVYQLLHPDLPREFPPLRSLNSLPNNLPVQVTSFIGREPELAAVKRLLSVSHLVTLVGSGGVGKTRLALQAAAELLEQYPDGVWLADLAPLAQPDLLPQAVGAAVGVHEEPGQTLLNTLTNALVSRELLLVLDNCEHLIDACARLADVLIHRCPKVHVLATSRGPLNIAGEATWRVPPMGLADPDHLPTLESLTQYEAVRLFIDRAVAVQPGFAVNNQNAPAVAQICHRLDGIPLAIELAAARVKVLAPEQIASRLVDRFRLLTGGSRTALPRQQTLRALIDWSHELLTDPERALFRRLSVFAGGWSLDTAEAVCGVEPDAESDVLALLGGLVDKSLIVTDVQSDGQMRYRLLETLREYAAERLNEAGERDDLLNRHAAYYLAEAERIDEVRKADWRRWRNEGWPWLSVEDDNIRTIFGHCRDGSADADGQEEIGLRLYNATWWFQGMQGRMQEQLEWYSALSTSTPVRVSMTQFLAFWFTGITAGMTARFNQSEPLMSQARELAAALGDQQAIALADGGTGQDFLWQGRLAEAELFSDRGLALARQVGPRYDLPPFLYNAGWTALQQGRLDKAAELLKESSEVSEQLGTAHYASVALPLRAEVALVRNDLEEAKAYLQRARQVMQWAPPTRGRGLPALGLGRVAFFVSGRLALQEGNLKTAREQFLAVIGNATHAGGIASIMISESLDGLACVADAQGDSDGAVRLVAATDRLRASTGQGRAPEDQRRVETDLVRLRQELGEPAFTEAWQTGSRLSLQEATQYARDSAR